MIWRSSSASGDSSLDDDSSRDVPARIQATHSRSSLSLGKDGEGSAMLRRAYVRQHLLVSWAKKKINHGNMNERSAELYLWSTRPIRPTCASGDSNWPTDWQRKTYRQTGRWTDRRTDWRTVALWKFPLMCHLVYNVYSIPSRLQERMFSIARRRERSLMFWWTMRCTTNDS